MKATLPSTSRVLRVLAGALVAALLCPALLHAAEEKSALAALVDSMPNCDRDGKYTGPAPDVAQKAIQQVLEGGNDHIIALVGMLKEPGKGDDYKAHYLLHATATHARRPGAEEERRMVSEALASTLDGPRPTIVKAHVLEELGWIGGEESVAAISKLLLDPELYDFAARALVAIKAAAPMRAALPKAKGRNRTALVQALGILRDGQAVTELLHDVADPDRDLRLAAIAALASIGDAAAVEPLLKAANVDSAYERTQVTDSLLTLASRLGEAGDKKGAERICRHLLETRTGPADVHVRCGAIIALAQAVGAEAMDEVLTAMSSQHPALRAAGLQAAITMPGAEATQRWVQRLKGADAARRVAILGLLAKRGDTAALPAVLEAMGSGDEQVRLAAIRAAGPTGDERAVAPLIAALTGKGAAESMAARRALLHIPGKPATAAVAKAIPSAAPALKAILLGIVAGREGKEHLDAILACTRDEDANVSAAATDALGRLAEVKDLSKLTGLLLQAGDRRVRGAAEKALASACERLGNKDQCIAAIAPALDGAKGDARAAIYRILAGIGNRTAFLVLRAGLADTDDAVRDAAIRGLADWPDDSPADDLLRVARTATNQTHHILAVRSYVRMIEARKSRPTGQSLKMCQAAMDVARRPDEKRQALAALGNLADPKALPIAQAQLKDKGVVNEAAMAVVKIARTISGANRDAARDAINGAMRATDSKAVHQQARSALKFIEQFEDFITGWMVSGPYPGGIGNKKSFPPEDPDAKDVKWKLVTAMGRRPGVVNLDREVSTRGNVTAYLRAQVWSPADQDARIEVGTDDGIKLWLNGKLIHVNDVPRSLTINEDKVQIKLKQGWNTLLLRVTEGGGGWEACARIRAADGTKLDGLRHKAE